MMINYGIDEQCTMFSNPFHILPNLVASNSEMYSGIVRKFKTSTAFAGQNGELGIARPRE